MRIRTLLVTTALLLAPALAMGQDFTPGRANSGRLDLGVRFTTDTGDAARYERYRDLTDGAFLEVARLERLQGNWRFNLAADHLGRKDQRLSASATRQGKVRGWFMWDQIPMLLSRTTQTFFQGDILNNNGVLTIDDAIQLQAQASTSNIPLLFVPPNTQTFDTRTRRHVAEAGVQFMPSADLTISGLFRNTERRGVIPYGGSFGHSSLVETLAPTNHTLRDVDAGAEFARGRYLLRAGYTGSFFQNHVTTLTFDSPFRAVDTSSASSRGRTSLPPSSSFMGVNGLASVRLPGKSRATLHLSTGSLNDAGDPLMPLSANSITTGQNPLPRQSVDGSAAMLSTNASFTSRPNRYFDFAVRFRSYEYDNQTPEFETFQRVAYDNSVRNEPDGLVTEPFSVNRRSFDADARYLPMAGTSLGIGYTHLTERRNHRIFEETTDNVYRVTFDTVGNRWLTVRTRYEHAQKRGEGFDEHLLTSVSEQPGMRHLDVASRDRDRVTLVGVLMPVTNLAVNVSVAAGNDDYLESVFGLRDNNHRVYGVGFDATPRENVAFGASYSRENYMALARSRQANPGVQFNDETRNWAVDTDDLVHSFILNADFTNLFEKLDVRLAWDLNRSTSTYSYITGPVADRTLPEETPTLPSSLPTPTQLPDVISDLDRGTADFVYNLNRRFGIGVSYWYERFDVQDFALDAESTGNVARSNAVLIGYLYRPYTAQTGWVRLIVRW
jgi:MtrB/PioB family decaheme-associated outer membrane protein